MQHKDEALALFNRGLTCSQAVAGTFAQYYGVDTDTVLKLSRGLGGGGGGLGGVCGAVSGAYMVLGLGYDSADPSTKTKLYAEIHEFTRRFHLRHGQVNCRDLLGCDVSSEAGKALIKERNMRNTHCAKFVQDAVEIIDELLATRA